MAPGCQQGWNEAGEELPPPYGPLPLGRITFTAEGRMLAALCRGGADASGGRGYSSYGGLFSFDGETLTVAVDMASDPARIGGRQQRRVRMESGRMILRPPLRTYGGTARQRELEWERVWRPRA